MHAIAYLPIRLCLKVSDLLEVTVQNSLTFPINFHIGTNNFELPGFVNPGPGVEPASIAPGDTATMKWRVTEEAGPGPQDVSSILWLYRSTVDHKADVYSGLLGPVVITRRGAAKADGRPIE